MNEWQSEVKFFEVICYLYTNKGAGAVELTRLGRSSTHPVAQAYFACSRCFKSGPSSSTACCCDNHRERYLLDIAAPLVVWVNSTSLSILQFGNLASCCSHYISWLASLFAVDVSLLANWLFVTLFE